jgi:glycosyltransferase involved in cell wall biosynthesis
MDTTATNTAHVSIIVPAYNEQDGIAACIQALLAQDYPPDCREIIIVDNNSKDHTREIVQQYPVTLLVEREIQGPAAARNKGILAAHGDIVAFTDADCLPRPDWLRNLTAAFSAPDIVGAVGTLLPAGDEGLIIDFMKAVNTIQSRDLGKFWYVVTANAAYKREVLLKLGLFDVNLYNGEDIDLGLRAQIEGLGRIIGVPDAVVDHPFENSWDEIWERFRRYGYSEILLDAMYQHTPGYIRPAGFQARQILRQVGALLVYIGSFIVRIFRCSVRGWNKKYVLWPLLWFSAEWNNLNGKLRGVIDTRFLSRVPTRAPLIREQ